MIEIIRQFVSMLRFIAELPGQYDWLRRRRSWSESYKSCALVEEFKEAIRNFAGQNKKKGTMLARMYRNVTSTAR